DREAAVVDREMPLGEVRYTTDDPDEWCDQALYQGLDDVAEGRANDNAHRQVDDIAPEDELPEDGHIFSQAVKGGVRADNGIVGRKHPRAVARSAADVLATRGGVPRAWR